ncbi:MAG: hypothetical protein ACM3X1_08120, partial [Ignavibacteriales bacterium]
MALHSSTLNIAFLSRQMMKSNRNIHRINLFLLLSLTIAGLLLVIASALPSYASVNNSNNSGTTNPYSTLIVTPNMIAAGGPIPPNYTLVQQEAECIAEQKNPPWYPTMLAYERGDSNRTGL